MFIYFWKWFWFFLKRKHDLLTAHHRNIQWDKMLYPPNSTIGFLGKWWVLFFFKELPLFWRNDLRKVIFKYLHLGSVWQLCYSACAGTWSTWGQEQDCFWNQRKGLSPESTQICQVLHYLLIPWVKSELSSFY